MPRFIVELNSGSLPCCKFPNTMKPRNDGIWMKILIEQTSLSSDLKTLAKQKGYLFVEELLNISVIDLSDDPWLTDDMMKELGALVKHQEE